MHKTVVAIRKNRKKEVVIYVTTSLFVAKIHDLWVTSSHNQYNSDSYTISSVMKSRPEFDLAVLMLTITGVSSPSFERSVM